MKKVSCVSPVWYFVLLQVSDKSNREAQQTKLHREAQNFCLFVVNIPSFSLLIIVQLLNAAYLSNLGGAGKLYLLSVYYLMLI